MPRGRKRGRPRTGSKPVVHVRLAAKQVKKIAKLAELEGVDRSTVMRQLIDIGLDSPQITLLMRRPGAKGRTAVDRVIRVVAANERVKVTQSAVIPAPSVETEVNALRAEEEQAEAMAAFHHHHLRTVPQSPDACSNAEGLDPTAQPEWGVEPSTRLCAVMRGRPRSGQRPSCRGADGGRMTAAGSLCGPCPS